MSLRSLFYFLARLLGDVNAVRRGPRAIAKRMARKAVHRTIGKQINKRI